MIRGLDWYFGEHRTIYWMKGLDNQLHKWSTYQSAGPDFTKTNITSTSHILGSRHQFHYKSTMNMKRKTTKLVIQRTTGNGLLQERHLKQPITGRLTPRQQPVRCSPGILWKTFLRVIFVIFHILILRTLLVQRPAHTCLHYILTLRPDLEHVVTCGATGESMEIFRSDIG